MNQDSQDILDNYTRKYPNPGYGWTFRSERMAEDMDVNTKAQVPWYLVFYLMGILTGMLFMFDLLTWRGI